VENAIVAVAEIVALAEAIAPNVKNISIL